MPDEEALGSAAEEPEAGAAPAPDPAESGPPPDEQAASDEAAGPSEPGGGGESGSAGGEPPEDVPEGPAAASPEEPAGGPAEEADDRAAEPPEGAGEDVEDEAGEQAEPYEEAGEAEDAEAVPSDIGGLSLPVVGRVPLKALIVMTGIAAAAFGGVLLVGIGAWSARRAPAPARRISSVAGAPTGPTQAAPAVDVSAFDYEELMEEAGRAVEDGDLSVAAYVYGAAAGREEAGLPKTLLARHKLAGVLLALGRLETCLRDYESLRSVSRPGDELWKHALIGSIRVLGEQQRWQDYFRHVHLLRANSARYADQEALNRWLAYCGAMGKTRIVLARSGSKGDLYGIAPPRLGRAECGARPLVAEDIIPTSGKYGDGTCEAAYDMGELRLLSEGAPLADVLKAVAEAADMELVYSGPGDYPVSACLETISPSHGLELVLGSLGLAAHGEGEKLVIGRLEPLPRSPEEAMKAALWGLQEFLILYPESATVPEAYYALAHLHMMAGRAKMALDQVSILCEEFPASPWAVYGHYMAGRACCERRNWQRAEDELLHVVDSDAEQTLRQSAFLWAAQSQVQLGKYDQAVACFRRALAYETQDPLTPSILYNIAYCLEKSGASPHEVEERYTELRTRYSGTEHAREADYRLARMAFDAGESSKAISRYEFYLSTYALEEERSCQACLDLLQSYMQAGENLRAAVLADVMCSTLSDRAELHRALLAVLEAYRKAGLQSAGLQAVDLLLAHVKDDRQRETLRVARAGFQVELGRLAEARASVDELGPELLDPELRGELKLVEAGLLKAEGKSDLALALCRDVALECRSERVRAAALRMIGRHCEATNQFDKAALAYAGKCPSELEGGSP